LNKEQTMTKQHTTTEQAEIAGQLVEMTLRLLHASEGIPMHVILAGAHASVVTMLVEELGGPMAAGSCERAAERVRTLPSREAVRLAVTPPAGQA
jgi:hypothetical protein